jgi:hypothetical protein
MQAWPISSRSSRSIRSPPTALTLAPLRFDTGGGAGTPPSFSGWERRRRPPARPSNPDCSLSRPSHVCLFYVQDSTLLRQPVHLPPELRRPSSGAGLLTKDPALPLPWDRTSGLPPLSLFSHSICKFVMCCYMSCADALFVNVLSWLASCDDWFVW